MNWPIWRATIVPSRPMKYVSGGAKMSYAVATRSSGSISAGHAGAVALHEGARRLRSVLVDDPEHDQAVVGMPLGGVAQQRELLDARPAPRCPEVDDHRAPAQVGEADRVAVEVGQGEVGRRRCRSWSAMRCRRAGAGRTRPRRAGRAAAAPRRRGTGAAGAAGPTPRPPWSRGFSGRRGRRASMRAVTAVLDLAPLPVRGADPPHAAEHEDHEPGIARNGLASWPSERKARPAPMSAPPTERTTGR